MCSLIRRNLRRARAHLQLLLFAIDANTCHVQSMKNRWKVRPPTSSRSGWAGAITSRRVSGYMGLRHNSTETPRPVILPGMHILASCMHMDVAAAWEGTFQAASSYVSTLEFPIFTFMLIRYLGQRGSPTRAVSCSPFPLRSFPPRLHIYRITISRGSPAATYSHLRVRQFPCCNGTKGQAAH